MGIVTDLENADLLTPNRLRLSRNIDRSHVGSSHVTSNPSKFIKENKLIFETWLETWLTSYVPTLMYRPKWFKNDRNLMIGDIVLFLKQDKNLSSIYQYGIVHSLKISKDGKIRRAVIKCRNHNESTGRYTNRTVREIVMIHPIDELDIITELCDQQKNVESEKNG